MIATKAVFYNVGVSPFPRRFWKENPTEFPEITLYNVEIWGPSCFWNTTETKICGVSIKNTTDFQKFRGVSKFRDVSKSKLSARCDHSCLLDYYWY